MIPDLKAMLDEVFEEIDRYDNMHGPDEPIRYQFRPTYRPTQPGSIMYVLFDGEAEDPYIVISSGEGFSTILCANGILD